MEVTVTRDDEMCLAFHRTFEDAIIVRVIGDDVQRGLGRDHLPKSP